MDKLSKRLLKDTMSDNSHFKYCEQCKTCMFKIGNNNFSNAYNKSSCKIYEHPQNKPSEIILNQAKCEFYEKEQ